jgi:hypothetical protein
MLDLHKATYIIFYVFHKQFNKFCSNQTRETLGILWWEIPAFGYIDRKLNLNYIRTYVKVYFHEYHKPFNIYRWEFLRNTPIKNCSMNFDFQLYRSIINPCLNEVIDGLIYISRRTFRSYYIIPEYNINECTYFKLDYDVSMWLYDLSGSWRLV